ncbi:MAG: glycoside hydrolase family 15 protein, partial [Pyrinomonadaceae bacterium]|nr:glycoside hydrolase family 15 protein [Pyrinomonadaceae bacterium]
SIVHYKKHRYFLINTQPAFDAYATGRKAFRNNEGTWRDAEDGELANGPITEGSVDSTIGVYFTLDANASHESYYWIAAGASHAEVDKLNSHALERGPEKYFGETETYWREWVNKNDTDFGDLPDDLIRFYKRSLLMIRTQIDHDGAIIAANDSDVSERATDNYSYSWMRDGSFVANALDCAGYPEISRKYFDFCERCMHPNGYFFQKYNADGTLGSSWHPRWDNYRKVPMVPIQEDETALVLWALWRHFEKGRDVEFVRKLYGSMIVPCANFLEQFRDAETKLPKPSWNLWEDRLGVHTFTCATVVAGLRAAANFAGLFNDAYEAAKYSKAADEIVEAMRTHLYSAEHGRFLRSLQTNGGDSLTPDATVDASLFAVFYFDCFASDDPMVTGTMQAINDNLLVTTEFGGVARFENDGYMRVSEDVTGNPWFICTLWLAEYYIAIAKTTDDLKPALDILEWTAKRALPSGVLAEQIDPLTGEPVSVSPLTWSHSTFVATVNSYLTKLKGL